MIAFLVLGGYLIWDVKWLPLLLCLAIVYMCLMLTSRKKIIAIQPILFFSSLLVLFFLIGSPLYPLSHLTFSFHMIHMSILFFIVPPLFLLSLPEQLQRFFTNKEKRLFPVLALCIFAGMFFVYHLPFIIHIVSELPFLYEGFLLVMFFLSFLMWWPLTVTVPSKWQKGRFARLSGVVMMPACLLFIVYALLGGIHDPFSAHMSSHLCFPPSYDLTSHLPFPYDSRIDQFLAGIVMLSIHKAAMMGTLKIRRKIKENMISVSDK